ncbi:agouti-signaling protein-like protein [Lates japonicus]|uniref:Agouti-signaling protein-like protein n=1 Tax=Lates japonicus TaxID=270547 RepID=A0AAD3R3Y0_LATJO|nr:agouti-signaling protein-like protein [Lates japonicus]
MKRSQGLDSGARDRVETELQGRGDEDQDAGSSCERSALFFPPRAPLWHQDMDLGSVRMKLALLCLCVLQVAFVSAGIFTRNDLQATYSNLSASRAQTSHSTGSLNQGRQKPLFARRGQYERQRIHVPKHRVVPIPPNDHPPPPPLSPKVAPKPVNPKCSQLVSVCKYTLLTLCSIWGGAPVARLFAGRRLLHRDGKRTVADCGACSVGYFTDNRNVRELQRHRVGKEPDNGQEEPWDTE